MLYLLGLQFEKKNPILCDSFSAYKEEELVNKFSNEPICLLADYCILLLVKYRRFLSGKK